MNVAINFSKTELLPRANAFIGIPVSFAYRTIDTAIGALGGLASMLTLGMEKDTMDFAATRLSSSRNILSTPYVYFLQVINPNATVNETGIQSLSRLHSYESSIDSAANAISKSPNFLERHVLSRVTYALLAVSCLIEAIAKGVMSLPAIALSILTLGTMTRINRIAYDSLSVTTGVISDLFYSALHIVNPQINTSLLLW